MATTDGLMIGEIILTALIPAVAYISVQINVVSVLSDSMYSDSPLVIEALAELLESATAHDDAAKSTPSATSPFNVHPLAGILPLNGQVNGESQSVMDELVAAIGLQRFRFVERQANGT